MLEKLWKAYKIDGDSHAREQIIQECLPLVKAHANRLNMYVSSSHDVEDLISAGIIGLIDAIEKFDPSKGAALKTYASYRIRGAILDEIRSLDWVPRSVREKAQKLERAYAALEQQTMTPPTEEDVAEYLDVSVAVLQQMLADISSTAMLMLEDLCTSKEDEETIRYYIADPNNTSPLDKITYEETRDMLAKAIDSLPEQERLTLSLYYFDELTMKEVGTILNVSESRVCQVHSSAILRLRNRLRYLESGFSER